jgi:hypothetical protein
LEPQPVGDWNSFTENSVAENSTHGPTHELTAINSTPMIYDAKGKLTTNSNNQTYSWDFENMMQSATVPVDCPDGIEGTHTYGYDALWRRVRKEVDDVITVSVSQTYPLAHYRSAGQVIAQYTGGEASANASESRVYGAYVDETVLLHSPPQTFHFHANDRYGVAALTDHSGNAAERYSWAPELAAAEGVRWLGCGRCPEFH